MAGGNPPTARRCRHADALDLLRHVSQHADVPLREVAQAVLAHRGLAGTTVASSA